MLDGKRLKIDDARRSPAARRRAATRASAVARGRAACDRPSNLPTGAVAAATPRARPRSGRAELRGEVGSPASSAASAFYLSPGSHRSGRRRGRAGSSQPRYACPATPMAARDRRAGHTAAASARARAPKGGSARGRAWPTRGRARVQEVLVGLGVVEGRSPVVLGRRVPRRRASSELEVDRHGSATVLTFMRARRRDGEGRRRSPRAQRALVIMYDDRGVGASSGSPSPAQYAFDGILGGARGVLEVAEDAARARPAGCAGRSRRPAEARAPRTSGSGSRYRYPAPPPTRTEPIARGLCASSRQSENSSARLPRGGRRRAVVRHGRRDARRGNERHLADLTSTSSSSARRRQQREEASSRRPPKWLQQRRHPPHGAFAAFTVGRRDGRPPRR